MSDKGTKNITRVVGNVKIRTKFNITDPYIYSGKHFKAMLGRRVNYFAAYNEALENAHRSNAEQQRKSVRFAVQETAVILTRLCMNQLAYRRKLTADKNNKISAAAGLQINVRAPFVLTTNRVRIKNQMRCQSLGTVDNHLDRLEECGFITMHVFKGTRANIELHIHPYFLLISDKSDHRYDPLQQPTLPIQLPQSLRLYYNTKENLNNIIMGGQNVEKIVESDFPDAHDAQLIKKIERELAESFGIAGKEGLCLTKEREAFDAFNRNLQICVKNVLERRRKNENSSEKEQENDTIPQNCRQCTEKGMVKDCQNCFNRETLKITDLSSYWNIIFDGGIRLTPAGRRKDADPVFRRRFYTTLLLAFATDKLFKHHKLYENEQRRAFRIILEHKNTYFKGCSSVEQYERELYRYCKRIKMAQNYAENHCFSMANIYPTAYFDPASKCKCHFRNTEKWLKASDYQKEYKEKLRQQRKEHKLLGEMFASLRDNPALDNFQHCEAVMRRNIPHCENVLYMFYRALLYEYNVLLNPNKNEYSQTGDISLPDGNAPP